MRVSEAWRTVKLADVLVQDRNYVRELDSREYPRLSVKLYGKGCVVNGSARGDEVRMQRHQLARPGQVILSEIWGKKGAIGTVPDDGDGALVTSHFFLFDLVSTEVDPAWLKWLIAANYFEPELSQEARGSTGYAAVRPKQFLELSIPLPPLDEQRRIVAKLDALRARVEQALALQAAAIAEAKALIDATLYAKFCEDTTADWQIASLERLAEIRAGVTLGRKIAGDTINVPYLRVANVQDGRLDLADIKEVAIRPDELAKWRLQPGDLILTEGGDFDKLGRGTIWRDEIPNCIHQNHIFRVRLNQEVILPEFMELEIRSPYGKDYFLSKAKKTTNLASINQTQLRAFPVRFPSKSRQAAIVAEIGELHRRIEKLIQAQRESEQELEAMLPAALDRAFRGEL